jgi:thiol-disulfide isomerase/thioredoxin
MPSASFALDCLLVAAALSSPASAQQPRDDQPAPVRFATFNVSLHRATAGDLIADLRGGQCKQAHAIAEIVQRVRPEVLLLNEIDFDAQGQALALLLAEYFAVAHGDAAPIHYAHTFLAPVNTGEPSGLDLDGDGKQDGPGDAFGYGAFPGQYGMAVLSQHAIARDEVRTFQKLLWRDMPDARLPADYYSEPARARLRLSSKSHWDVPLDVKGVRVHFLVSHPTPPVFDGPEDRNGRRNADEIRFWADYIDPVRSAWIRDDAGRTGGLADGALFVIAGDLNADPADGDSKNVIAALLQHPRIDAQQVPASDGAAQAAKRQAGANARQRGDPRHDTGDFNDRSAGNLRVDYVLPARGLAPAASGVFWPAVEDATFALVGAGDPAVSSDHRLVWLDLVLPQSTSTAEPQPERDLRHQPFGDFSGTRLLTPFTFAGHELTLIRWWTNGCPFCADSLPALERLRQRYGDKGLAVVGMYHPKPVRAVADAEVRAFAAELGFAGALAIDPEWLKLAELQARGAPVAATSISVLVDRSGKIVWVHPGPRLHERTDPQHAAAAQAFRDLEGVLRERLR